MLTRFTPGHRGGSGSPLLLLHGFADSWRTWELVLPALERSHDVLAPTLPGHAGGPPLDDAVEDALVDGAEAALDAAGIERAHVVGNSLGGYVALRLAERGRALSVVAFAPAGGWAADDPAYEQTLAVNAELRHAARTALPFIWPAAATRAGRHQATRWITVRSDHLPPGLVVHLVEGAARCDSPRLLALAPPAPWPLAAERIDCPVRIVWGTSDLALHWPDAAAAFRGRLHAEWIELDDVGHCPQLDVPLETAQLILDFTA